ncbi:hypothetical protein NDU88_001657 [Pleurodeles waltl]|uniref:Uncharacterized protein n=1 Tax=Pleurodeles waltl TaxID=8319 RepID=A0AAV7P8L5_PLEWA|nr:hypothetical protein NDU88_001657 [Pleurodeles waltl]
MHTRRTNAVATQDKDFKEMSASAPFSLPSPTRRHFRFRRELADPLPPTEGTPPGFRTWTRFAQDSCSSGRPPGQEVYLETPYH